MDYKSFLCAFILKLNQDLKFMNYFHKKSFNSLKFVNSLSNERTKIYQCLKSSCLTMVLSTCLLHYCEDLNTK